MADWKKAVFQLSDIRILFYLKEKGKARYYELSDDVIESRSTLAGSLRELQEMGLIKRNIKDTRPVQTEYLLTEKGTKIAQLLNQIKEMLGF